MKTKLFKLIAAVFVALCVLATSAFAGIAAAEGEENAFAVKTLTVGNAEVYEYSNYDVSEYDMYGEIIYYYNPEITAELEDGTVLTVSDRGVEYNGEWVPVVFEDGQYEEPWGVGAHTVTASFGGATAEFTVEVKPYPIADVKFDAIEVDELLDVFDSTLDEDHKAYYFVDPGFTVTFTDGSTLRVEAEEIDMSIEHVNFTYDGCLFLFDFRQYINPETDLTEYSYSIGEHKYVPEIVIRPTVFKSIEVEPVTLTEGKDMVSVESGWDSFVDVYDYTPVIKVTLTDGTVCTNDGLNIIINGKRYSSFWFDTQDVEPWGLGDHTFTVEIGSVPLTATGTATVVPANGATPDSKSDTTSDATDGTQPPIEPRGVATGDSAGYAVVLATAFAAFITAAFTVKKKKA